MTTITPPEAPVSGDGDGSTRSTIGGRVSRELKRALIDPSAEQGDVMDFSDRPVDRVAAFGPVIMAMRLATTAVTLLLAGPGILAGDTRLIISALVVTVYALLRSFRPIRYTDDFASLVQVIFEVALHVGVVNLTGYWESPLIFSLITSVSIAGFARGIGFATRIAVAASLAVSLPPLLEPGADSATLKTCATWSLMLVLVGIVAGYGRRISGEADRERDLALDRLSRLADANALLYSLHRVAQTLPASLDLRDVLDSTVQRLRGLVEFDSLVILLFEDTDGFWSVARREGCSGPNHFRSNELPSGIRAAIAEGGVVSMPALTQPDNVGFDEHCSSGLYAPLSARGSIIGLIALEHREPNRFDHRAGGLLAGFVPPLSLALDNATWFARLRTVGADEERTRIARDLHDRIGQSLAYLAFELDRIVGQSKDAEPELSQALDHLRDDVRGVIREVRDTLYDLRTDVSEEQSLAVTLEQYADRVADRTGLDFQVDADPARLPLLQEREMWRIVQEAITNVERHAKATRVRVTWRCDGERAAVRVTDNGVGFELQRAGRLDSYGMLGMRERASSIGATIDIHSVPGQGTSITCVLDPSYHPPGDDHQGPSGGQSAPHEHRELTATGGSST